MPDTGAPWNIPYVDPTDLVRDYPGASEDLAEAIADGLDAAGNPGIGSNVVQTVKTDTFASGTISEGGEAVITGLSATITPSGADSRVLVIADVSASTSTSGGRGFSVIVRRDGSPISIGDADGSRGRVTAGGGEATFFVMLNTTAVIVDSPNTTDPVEYTVALRLNSELSATLFCNRSPDDSNAAGVSRAASRITLIEVAA
jgi:hypothetical protein